MDESTQRLTEGAPPHPSLVASTGSIYCSTIKDVDEQYTGANQNESAFFKNAQWTADGTCIITNSADSALRTFVLPEDVLTSPPVHELRPYATIAGPEPVYSFAPYPFYNLTDPSTTLVLSSVRAHPISLDNALLSSGRPDQDGHYPSAKVASYPLFDCMTEEAITPHSLTFTLSGTHFIAGCDNLIAAFDVNRSGEPPVERHKTIPSKRKNIVGGGVGMRGIVSALAINDEGMLAAGTFTSSLGLYASEGRGECVAVFGLKGGEDSSVSKAIAGAGVTSVHWSPCGRYLYIAERKSDCVLVYDIRVTGRRLGWLAGRRARTNQRLGLDVSPTAYGHEIWSGGTDGIVRVWQNPSDREGKIEPESSWQAHSDPVSSTIVHSSGSIVATCSGERKFHSIMASSLDEDPSELPSQGSRKASPGELGRSSTDKSQCSKLLFDNTLKVWSVI